MERLARSDIEIRRGVLRLPVVLDNLKPRSVRLPVEQRNQFMRALAVVERGNQRLDNAHRTVVGASVAPLLQIVGLGDVPVAKFAGLVVVQTKVYAHWNIAVLERIGEGELGTPLAHPVPSPPPH